MTNQEAFDTMVRHLRKQGRKSQDDERQTCLYRGPNGLKCAVGALIPDEEYRPEWDEKGMSASKIVKCCHALQGVDSNLLSIMQTIHDHCSITNWEAHFKSTASNYGLTLPPLEAAHA